MPLRLPGWFLRWAAPQVPDNPELLSSLRLLEQDLKLATVQRLSAETLLVERSSEIERLRADLVSVRETLQIVLTERIRAAEALNLKLLAPSSEPTLQSLSSAQASNLRSTVISETFASIQERHRLLDRALLGKFHPGFQAKVDLRENPESGAKVPINS